MPQWIDHLWLSPWCYFFSTALSFTLSAFLLYLVAHLIGEHLHYIIIAHSLPYVELSIIFRSYQNEKSQHNMTSVNTPISITFRRERKVLFALLWVIWFNSCWISTRIKNSAENAQQIELFPLTEQVNCIIYSESAARDLTLTKSTEKEGICVSCF